MQHQHPAGWQPDPSGLFDQRYWDGNQWTSQVSTDGVVGTDPANQSSTTVYDQAQPHPTRIMPQQTQHAIQPYVQPQQPGLPEVHPQPPMQASTYSAPVYPSSTVVVVRPAKSRFVAFILTFLFGPLGMLYSTVSGALIMLLISVLGAFVTLGLSIFITWPICIVWGIAACGASRTTQVHTYH